MKDCIETACFHYFGGRKMIYASNIEAEWLNDAKDVRECYNKLFDKNSGTSIVMFSPIRTGIILVISKIIPNRFGDNLTAYLKIPYGLDISGESLQGILFDVISALAQNRKDAVVSCLSSVSKQEYDILPMQETNPKVTNDYAYRMVSSGVGRESLSLILNNLFQNYYFDYKYIFLAIDNQYVANKVQHTDLTAYPIKNWRIKKEMTKVGEPVESDSTIKGNYTEEKASVNQNQPAKITSKWLKKTLKLMGVCLSFYIQLLFVV